MTSKINSHPHTILPQNTAIRERNIQKDGRPLFSDDAEILPELISQLLQDGHNVRFRAPGKSMRPSILDGDVLIVEPIEPDVIKIGDIILYQADASMIAHRVIDIEKVASSSFHSASMPSLCSVSNAERKQAPCMHYSFILRGDASYSYDEPVYAEQILGKIVALERHNRSINPYSFKHKLACRVRVWACRLKRMYN